MFVDRSTLNGILSEVTEAEIEGMKFRFPSLVHLIALKLHSIKHNPSREHRDLFDVIELMKRNRIDVHTDHFKKLCLKFGAAELFKKILSVKGL